MKPWIFLVFSLWCGGLWAQSVVQVSGVILTRDTSLQTIPNARLWIQGRSTTTTSGDDGFFSITAVPGDTLRFRRFGFEDERLWVPDTLDGKSYLASVFMRWNTVELDEVTLYPWPRPEDLNRELLRMRIETTERDVALQNLAIQALKEKAALMGMSSNEMQRYIIQAQEQQLYNSGRYYGSDGASAILGRLSNPFAWAQFFQSLKKR
ncbi:MAG: carboxypeptidase regulatory-like domain-containing protein [Bacteroidetes bacterium]|nr:carboxypeptidase regulatory-like domain-containing protein [Bacteroidota bacterium]